MFYLMYEKIAFYARISKASKQNNPISNSINSQINILYDTVQILNSNNCCIDINNIQIYIEMKIRKIIQFKSLNLLCIHFTIFIFN